MVIAGGYSGPNIYSPDSTGTVLGDVYNYDPTTDRWTTWGNFSPIAQWYWDSAIVAGSEMILWGGFNGNYVPSNNGAIYDPSQLQVLGTTSIGNAPSARYYHSAVWTGSEMIVWGGYDNNNYFNDGGRYNPSSAVWTALPATTLSSRLVPSMVWTGTDVLVWGGGSMQNGLNDGADYNRQNNGWTMLPTLNAPAARVWHSTVWTGIEMIVWGGGSGHSGIFNTGARYVP
jgi:N-acetylneuraminic acid mutarotase